MSDLRQAHALLSRFKGATYVYGFGVLPQVGQVAVCLGNRAALVRDRFPAAETYLEAIEDSLKTATTGDLSLIRNVDT